MLMGVGKAPRSMGPESVSRRISPGHMGQVRTHFSSQDSVAPPLGEGENIFESLPQELRQREVRAPVLRGGITTGSNNFVESWMNWSVAGNGGEHWDGLLERSPGLGELMEYLVFPSRVGRGPKPFPVYLLKDKRHSGTSQARVPELVLKAQLGADKAPRHNWWGDKG